MNYLSPQARNQHIKKIQAIGKKNCVPISRRLAIDILRREGFLPLKKTKAEPRVVDSRVFGTPVH